MTLSKSEEHFGRWKKSEEIAESMIPIIGQMHRQGDVTISCYSRSLVNKSVIEILQIHRHGK